MLPIHDGIKSFDESRVVWAIRHPITSHVTHETGTAAKAALASNATHLIGMADNNRMRPLHHWGNQLWAYLHTITIIDSDEPAIQIRESVRAIEILRNVPAIIPCHRCATHFQEFFQTEIEGRSRFQRMELFDLMVEYHNQINQKVGKPNMSLEDARSLWAKTV